MPADTDKAVTTAGTFAKNSGVTCICIEIDIFSYLLPFGDESEPTGNQGFNSLLPNPQNQDFVIVAVQLALSALPITFFEVKKSAIDRAYIVNLQS